MMMGSSIGISRIDTANPHGSRTFFSWEYYALLSRRQAGTVFRNKGCDSEFRVMNTRVHQHENRLSPSDGSAIEALARDMGAEPAFVKELYERELAHLEVNAKVRGFLSVLACRNVRMALRKTRAGSS